jgi:hypothetical protein
VIVTAGKKEFVRGQSRLFMSMWLLINLVDALAISAFAMLGKLDLENINPEASMAYEGDGLGLNIFLPIFKPMKLTIANSPIDRIIVTIEDKNTSALEGEGYNINEFPAINRLLDGLVFLRFYEQHRPTIRSKYGRDTKAWPQTFQFAWMIRNAFTHHGGHINFANPNYPAVSWQKYSYSPTDNGKPLFSTGFSSGVFLVFLFDLSDELDAIGAPFPLD